MAKLRIIVEVEDVDPTLVDPIEAADAVIDDEAPVEVLDAEFEPEDTE